MSFEVKNVKFEIVNGPSRDMIFDSMKYSYETRIPLEFEIVKGYSGPKDDPTSAAMLLNTRDIEVHTIQHEDGTGFKFNLKGYLDVKDDRGYLPRKFKAFYNAKTRKGTITIDKF